MDSPDEVSGPINLGNPGEFTMIELAEAVKGLTGSRSELMHEPPLCVRGELLKGWPADSERRAADAHGKVDPRGW